MTNGRTLRSSSSPSPDERTLSGLLTVLERADALPSRGRLRPRRAVLHTAAGTRGQRLLPTARPVPTPRPRPAAQAIRPPLAPAPVMWRPVLPGSPATVAQPVLPARRPGLVRRLALWGAGQDGEHLAWNRPRPMPAPESVPVPPPAPAGARASKRAVAAGRFRRQVRRLALWGAGADGRHLAWNAPPPPRVYSARLPVPPASTAAVRLTALPSTPTIKPAASSPVAALSPALHLRAAGSSLRAPARPPRASQPRASESPVGWPTHPATIRPEPCPALPAPSGWPNREPGVRACARSPGRARTRGDPPACRVRGSPP